LREKSTPKQNHLNKKTRLWIWFITVAIIISLASGAFTYVLLLFDIDRATISQWYLAGWVPAFITFGFTLIGILVGLSLGCKLMASNQDHVISRE
jgi:cytochrome b subunit of formate dehydrogenase